MASLDTYITPHVKTMQKKIPFINLFQLFFRFILFSYFCILSLRFYYVFITLSFCFLLTIDRLQTTYRFKVQEKSPVFFIFCRKKKLFWFLNVLYSICDCIYNYSKVLWNEQYFIGKTKKQYTTKIFTIKIQNLNIKSNVFFT